MDKILELFGFLNFKKYCQEYKVGLWECPPFIFFLMGMIIICAILVTYFVGRIYVEPLLVVLIICIVTVILFVLSYVIMNSFERIARVSKDKSEFISIMSHQLRNPLSSIKWQLDLLLHKNAGLSGPGGQEALGAIEEQNERMIGMINDLLEVNRLENESAVLMETVFSLVDLVREIIAGYTERAAFSNIELIFSQPEKDISLKSDRDKIGSAVSHLLDNSIRYSPNGGKVNVLLERIDDKARLSIMDEGIGIVEEEAGQIFKKFFRGSVSRKYKSDGLGIGLYLVKSIIELFGGRVGFSSVEGRGSIFWFELPIKS